MDCFENIQAEDAEKRAKAMIDEENARIEKEQGSALLSKLSRMESAERKRVSESRYAADRKVLLHRNALVDGLFDDIRAELKSLADSDKYKAHLTKCAERADSEEKITAMKIKAEEKKRYEEQKRLFELGIGSDPGPEGE